MLFVPHYGNNKISTHEFNVVQLPHQINFHYEKEITATDHTCTNKDLTHPLPNPMHPANPPHLENPTIWSSSKLPNNIHLCTKFINQLLQGDQAPLLLLRQKGFLHDLQNFSKYETSSSLGPNLILFITRVFYSGSKPTIFYYYLYFSRQHQTISCLRNLTLNKKSIHNKNLVINRKTEILFRIGIQYKPHLGSNSIMHHIIFKLNFVHLQIS